MSCTPALLIAGSHSGCGKTTLSLGLMAALARRGLKVQPFKCGPDFIDPSLHEMVTGRVSRNLDLRMCGPEWVRQSFARHTAAAAGIDCAVVEGVMGLFDGGQASAAALAKLLQLPVVLALDVRSAAESIAAVVKGFDCLDPELRLAGVICNRSGSAKHMALIREALAPLEAPLLGFLPRNERIAMPSRHLGLHMGAETPLDASALEQLVQLIETHLDLDGLLRLARMRTALAPGAHPEASKPPKLQPSAQASIKKQQRPVRIGVARDAAFCFYYQDNLDLLRAEGAELVFFSPLQDGQLPSGLGGLYLGGGYPELFAGQLTANTMMRQAIRAFSQAGLPVYAECGGFMYLCRALRDLDGACHQMAAVFPFTSAMQPRLHRLGYRAIRVSRDTFLAPRGTELHGHEFHYSALVDEAEHAAVKTAYLVDDARPEGYCIHQTLAGYTHLHWGQTPHVAAAFTQACRSSSL